MKATTQAYAAIRRNSEDHHEFIDLSTLSYDFETCNIKSRKLSREIPNWTYDNPIRRVVQVLITEI